MRCLFCLLPTTFPFSRQGGPRARQGPDSSGHPMSHGRPVHDFRHPEEAGDPPSSDLPCRHPRLRPLLRRLPYARHGRMGRQPVELPQEAPGVPEASENKDPDRSLRTHPPAPPSVDRRLRGRSCPLDWFQRILPKRGLGGECRFWSTPARRSGERRRTKEVRRSTPMPPSSRTGGSLEKEERGREDQRDPRTPRPSRSDGDRRIDRDGRCPAHPDRNGPVHHRGQKGRLCLHGQKNQPTLHDDIK